MFSRNSQSAERDLKLRLQERDPEVPTTRRLRLILPSFVNQLTNHSEG
jgi:hypothetical protein